MRIEWNAVGDDPGPAAASNAVDLLLHENRLLSMATMSRQGTPWANNAYFAHDAAGPGLDLYFLTRPGGRHGVNLDESAGAAAVTVTDSTQQGIPGTRRGLQLRGVCARAAGARLDRGAAVFAARFPAAAAHAAAALAGLPELAAESPRLYVFSATEVKLFCEPALGTEIWLTGRIAVPAPPAPDSAMSA